MKYINIWILSKIHLFNSLPHLFTSFRAVKHLSFSVNAQKFHVRQKIKHHLKHVEQHLKIIQIIVFASSSLDLSSSLMRCTQLNFILYLYSKSNARALQFEVSFRTSLTFHFFSLSLFFLSHNKKKNKIRN